MKTVRNLVAFASVLVCAWPLHAKTVVCINDINDSFTNNYEGYLCASLPADTVFSRTGTLTDCLGLLVNGDTLIIVTHGVNDGQGFKWAGTPYNGFGTGPGKMPVPNGFSNLHNITVIFACCWSTRDPDGASGPDTSLTDKIIVALGGAGHGNAATGYEDIAHSGSVNYLVRGGTPAQKQAAMDCLDNNTAWVNNRPANTPNTGGPGQPPNQQSAAQAQANGCAGTGGAVTILIPNLIAQDQPRKTAGYKPPYNSQSFVASEPDERGCGCVCLSDCGCGDPPEGLIDDGSFLIPTVSEWGLVVVGISLLIAGTIVVRRGCSATAVVGG